MGTSDTRPELHAALRRAVGRLSSKERLIVRRDLEGRGVADTTVLARELNATPERIDKWRLSARKKLARGLRSEGRNLTWVELLHAVGIHEFDASPETDSRTALEAVERPPLTPRQLARQFRGSVLHRIHQEPLDSRSNLVADLKRTSSSKEASPRYRLTGEIARGGMGEVVKVWDKNLNRELAMKRIGAIPTPDSTDEDREAHEHRLSVLIEEARVTSQLSHPGIVPVHDIGVDSDGSVYFTMPLVRGQDMALVLRQMHDGASDWNLSRVLRVLLQVCETVAFAHSEGVIHRDLKPSNIMVGPFGEAYVMDWGLALVAGEPSSIVGTPAYMSPEQAGRFDAEVGPRSDVYSLGAILYQVLAGMMPHESSIETGAESRSWMGSPPQPLHHLAPDIPRELVAVCEKAMAPHPGDRYSGAMAMATDLRAYLEGRVVGAYESGSLARTRKWFARNRGLALVLQAVILILALAGGTVLTLQQRTLQLAAEKAVHDERVLTFLAESRQKVIATVRGQLEALQSIQDDADIPSSIRTQITESARDSLVNYTLGAENELALLDRTLQSGQVTEEHLTRLAESLNGLLGAYHCSRPAGCPARIVTPKGETQTIHFRNGDIVTSVLGWIAAPVDGWMPIHDVIH